MTREEKIDWLCRLRACLNDGCIFTPWNKQFTEALDETLEQEPRTGHWLGDSAEYRCNKCGHGLLEIAHSIDYINFKRPNFCPNCGVDMREVVENGNGVSEVRI